MPADDRRKDQDAKIDPDGRDSWKTRRCQCHEHRHQPPRRDETRHSTGNREERALGEHLPRHTPPLRTKSPPHGHFMTPSTSVAEQQTGNIGARDRQEQQ